MKYDHVILTVVALLGMFLVGYYVGKDQQNPFNNKQYVITLDPVNPEELDKALDEQGYNYCDDETGPCFETNEQLDNYRSK